MGYAAPKPCEKCGLNEMEIGEAQTTDGRTIYPFVCVVCGKVHTQYAKRAVALEHIRKTGKPLPQVKTATQSKPERFAAAAEAARNRRCEVCGEGYAQWHHWAPYHLFGVEAERWPKGLLCQPCHTRWHQIVTPNMGQSGKPPHEDW